MLQLKLHSRVGNQPYKTLKHQDLGAAYDFMLVRERATNVRKEPEGNWWEKFQLNDQALRSKLINSLKEKNEKILLKNLDSQKS